MLFSTDTDLLHWEPNIFRDAAFASQTLFSGTGDLAGTLLVVTSGPSLLDCHVKPNQVAVLSGTGVSGSFPVTSVDDATRLTLSVLYDGLEPNGDLAPQPSPVGTATAVPFVVRTFWAQRRVVSDLLLQSLGIEPGTSDETTSVILNPQALKRAAILGTLQLIYSALSAASPEMTSEYSLRADLYERLYRRALRSLRIEIDLNGDGKADCARRPGLVELVRV